MIGRLTGAVVEIDGHVLLLDVAGVGYEVEVSSAVLTVLPEHTGALELHTHLVVREDAQLLYGFATRSERDLFRGFIRINGVGPKLALALISALDVRSLAAAVRSNDVSVLTRVPGVGKKTAERLMVELKNRLDTLTDTSGVALSVVSVSTGPRAQASEAEHALTALGYRPQEASRAVDLVLRAHDGSAELSAEDIVRQALRTFAKANPS